MSAISLDQPTFTETTDDSPEAVRQQLLVAGQTVYWVSAGVSKGVLCPSVAWEQGTRIDNVHHVNIVFDCTILW